MAQKNFRFAAEYIEMILETVADHGPCVSGAHNAIVAARAGKDVVSSLASGLLTIGPRFGGAIDEPQILSSMPFPEEFHQKDLSEKMKKKAWISPELDTKLRASKTPIDEWKVWKTLRKHTFLLELLDYALAVEAVTTAKKERLFSMSMAVLVLPLWIWWRVFPSFFSDEEIREVIRLGMLNGLLFLDEALVFWDISLTKTDWGQGLYPFPMDDVLYLTRGEMN